MLRVARRNVKQAQKRYKKYVDEHCRLISFQEGEKVFLKVFRTFSESEDLTSG